MTSTATIWTHSSRQHKVVVLSTKKKRMSKKDSRKSIVASGTKTISDPNFRKCNDCSAKVNRKLLYAVDSTGAETTTTTHSWQEMD